MIDKALEVVAAQLDHFLNSKMPEGEGVELIISELMNQDGSLKTFNNNVITLTLLNVEEEKSLRNLKANPGMRPPVHLNLHVLFSVFYGDSSSYLQTLRLLSVIIAFFQSYAIFDHQNTPDLDQSIEKMVFDLENQNMQALNYTWSMLGNRHLPSVMYRIRMITIQEGLLENIVVPFTGFGSSTGS